MRYDNTPILKDKTTGRRYYKNTLYPQINPKLSDIYVITNGGDRLDLLANQYYKDPTLWWIIASANNMSKDSIYITPGTQLRIPTDITSFLDEYDKINNNR